jgi:histidinol dehydrogenase
MISSGFSSKDALQIARLDSTSADFDEALAERLHWDVAVDGAVNRTAEEIFNRVRSEGVTALLELTAQLERWQPQSIADVALSVDDFAQAYAALPSAQADALQLAAQRIRDYHKHQMGSEFEYTDALGNRLGQRVTPLDSVGLYVPGGQAAYPSTVLMTAVPAKVAGVGELVMVTPTPGGKPNPLVLAAAHVAGVDRGFAVGGAQAIAALALGTAGLPKVDKIVGPGGAYVAAAKRLVYGLVGIDSIAGPSEVLVIADKSAPAQWVALDLFSQAEHDAAAQAILVSADADYLDTVAAEMQRLLAEQPRAEVIAKSLQDRGALILVRDTVEAIAIANRVAPEHLQLAVADPEMLVPHVRHAGAIFVGARSAEVLGDYVAGPSHVLPTFGTARFSSPLSVYDFQKRTSVINVSARGALVLGAVAGELADGEGLAAHASAARARMTNR